jgi:phospholipid/cholesterol/gamma-HCH transport system substrate-binding protein
MFKGDRNFAVGLFVTIAIAAFVAFVIWLTGRTGVEEMKRYTLLFDRDVGGLAVGGPVKYMGMSIGSVVQMSLERQDEIRIRVDIDILESTPVDSGTYASLAMQGITGVAVVNLASEMGVHPPLEVMPGWEHPVIPVRDVGFAAVLSSMPEIMNKLDHLLSQASEILGEENRASITGALSDVNAMTSALAENRESLAAIPNDLRSTMAGIQSTVAQLQEVITRLQPDLDGTMKNIQQSSENLVSLTARVDALIQEHESDMGRFMEDGLGQAPALMRETRNTLREMEKLLAELKDDPSQLVHRPPVEEVEIDP